MIYTALTNKTMKLAYNAHRGQVDAAGMPYIFHPYSIAEQMDNERRTCIALLHDVLEDTKVTLDQLKQEYLPEITDAVVLLTHDKKQDYFDYVCGLCVNTDAMLVKYADLLHNQNEARMLGMKNVPEKFLESNRKKYGRAIAILDDVMKCWEDDEKFRMEWRLKNRLLERMREM